MVICRRPPVKRAAAARRVCGRRAGRYNAGEAGATVRRSTYYEKVVSLSTMDLIKPQVVPPLDPSFRPAVLANRAFLAQVDSSGAAAPLKIAVERGEGATSIFETRVFASGHPKASANLRYSERLVKFLLWQRGGWKVTIAGPAEIAEHIKSVYSPNGERKFDYDFMGGVYEKTFTVENCAYEDCPPARETAAPVGRHLKGCRVGFDAGASDWKVSAVIDGEPVFTTETPWDPRNNTDPQYHYDQINSAFELAASKMPRVDAIGVSSAGVYIDNKVRVASLFRGIPKDLFEKNIRPLFLRLREKWGVPLEVANDGDVTALAGSMSLGTNRILGIAMGSSEAVGYVDAHGNITGWLNELAFAPVDYRLDAPADEWSGDIGCGVQYFCQQAVIRLAPAAGITLKEGNMPGDKLLEVQALMKNGDERARRIYETIGVFTAYGVAHYADFYDLENVLILGRVTSGEGGTIILDTANAILAEHFPDLTGVKVNMPDEASKRVGQAVAAASLPQA